MTNNFQEFYKRIGYLRSSGVKMKEIADWISIAPSVLSSLYTTVLPDYFESIKTNHPDEALDHALAQVNNVSKRRLLAMKSGLVTKEDFTPEQQAYYDYTCQTGDYIKMCTVPSLRMDESDLIKEKKMLAL